MRSWNKITICFAVIILIIQMPLFAMASEYSNEGNLIYPDFNVTAKLDVSKTTISSSGDEVSFKVMLKNEKELSYGLCGFILQLKDSNGDILNPNDYIDIDNCNYSNAFYETDATFQKANQTNRSIFQITPLDVKNVTTLGTYIDCITLNIKTKDLSVEKMNFQLCQGLF